MSKKDALYQQQYNEIIFAQKTMEWINTLPRLSDQEIAERQQQLKADLKDQTDQIKAAQ